MADADLLFEVRTPDEVRQSRRRDELRDRSAFARDAPKCDGITFCDWRER
jgi:hypothetical protein